MRECVVVGRGALGVLYYEALSSNRELSVRFAADRERVERYQSERLLFRGRELEGNYFTPKTGDAPAKVVLITTKWNGLHQALSLIEAIVDSNTIILPLLNGLLPWEIVRERFPLSRVLRGYYIGTTASRSGHKVNQSGNYTTVIEPCTKVEKLFDSANVSYEVAPDIEARRWQKFILNIGLNQCSALEGGLSYGEIKSSTRYRTIVSELMSEAATVAKAYGIEGAENMAHSGVEFLEKLTDSDYSSMAQDIRAGRAHEGEIFGKDLLRRASKVGLNTPVNRQIIEEI